MVRWSQLVLRRQRGSEREAGSRRPKFPRAHAGCGAARWGAVCVLHSLLTRV